MNLRFNAEFGSGGAQPMQLRIGAIEAVLHSWLIEWVQALRKEHPALELALTVESVLAFNRRPAKAARLKPN